MNAFEGGGMLTVLRLELVQLQLLKVMESGEWLSLVSLILANGVYHMIEVAVA